MIEKLFTDWDLDTWANVLEILGFGITVISLIIALFVKSELTRLKLNYIFDKRINEHSKSLQKTASALNKLYDEYDINRDLIKMELRICISELEDLKSKLGFWKSFKSRRLIYFTKRRLTKPFEKKEITERPLLDFLTKYLRRVYVTTYDDNWQIYSRIYSIIRQIENIKKNKDKSLSL